MRHRMKLSKDVFILRKLDPKLKQCSICENFYISETTVKISIIEIGYSFTDKCLYCSINYVGSVTRSNFNYARYQTVPITNAEECYPDGISPFKHMHDWYNQMDHIFNR